MRLIAEIYKGDRLINLELVKKGHAFVYHQYLSSCQENKDDYLNAELTAKKDHDLCDLCD